jgi:hypothetical protein
LSVESLGRRRRRRRRRGRRRQFLKPNNSLKLLKDLIVIQSVGVLIIIMSSSSSTHDLPAVPRRKLGPDHGLEVSALGLGCMGMSSFYGTPKPEEEMIELIRYAVQCGITLLDTADVYGPHTNEVLIGKVSKQPITATTQEEEEEGKKQKTVSVFLWFLVSFFWSAMVVVVFAFGSFMS